MIAFLVFACSSIVPEPEPPEPPPPPPPPMVVDVSGWDLSCVEDADCALVRPSRCGPCGCTDTPIAARDLERFSQEAARVRCPPPNPITDPVCGGCMSAVAVCRDGQCFAKPQ